MPSIAILHVPDCAGGAAALSIARDIAAARDDVTVADVIITPDVDPVALGFRGSPTILVDGADLEMDPRTPLGSMG